MSAPTMPRRVLSATRQLFVQTERTMRVLVEAGERYDGDNASASLTVAATVRPAMHWGHAILSSPAGCAPDRRDVVRLVGACVRGAGAAIVVGDAPCERGSWRSVARPTPGCAPRTSAEQRP